MLPGWYWHGQCQSSATSSVCMCVCVWKLVELACTLPFVQGGRSTAPAEISDWKAFFSRGGGGTSPPWSPNRSLPLHIRACQSLHFFLLFYCSEEFLIARTVEHIVTARYVLQEIWIVLKQTVENFSTFECWYYSFWLWANKFQCGWFDRSAFKSVLTGHSYSFWLQANEFQCGWFDRSAFKSVLTGHSYSFWLWANEFQCGWFDRSAFKSVLTGHSYSFWLQANEFQCGWFDRSAFKSVLTGHSYSFWLWANEFQCGWFDRSAFKSVLTGHSDLRFPKNVKYCAVQSGS